MLVVVKMRSVPATVAQQNPGWEPRPGARASRQTALGLGQDASPSLTDWKEAGAGAEDNHQVVVASILLFDLGCQEHGRGLRVRCTLRDRTAQLFASASVTFSLSSPLIIRLRYTPLLPCHFSLLHL